jgi:leucyl aminopeptidase
MPAPLLVAASVDAIPVWLATDATWPEIRHNLPPVGRAFAEAQGFEPKAGAHALLPDAGGRLAAVLFGLDGAKTRRPDPFLVGKLPTLLPAGVYSFATPPADAALASLAWLLGSYRFTRYRERPAKAVRLVSPQGVDADEVMRMAEAVALGRDLVNTPANDLGPDGIESAARRLARSHGASVDVVVGDDLLDQNFPMIHAVGRASGDPPRLIDLRWGEPDAPLVAVVGKGVAFDTGGLDIKPSSAMALMKKDMGGAAAATALAAMIMGAKLPVRLRLLIPAVENAIAGTPFRPATCCAAARGLSVEIGNTDAEGRLILADALALADEEKPALIVDFATLTGAARVALGPDLPPFFTHDETLAADLARLARRSTIPPGGCRSGRPMGRSSTRRSRM